MALPFSTMTTATATAAATTTTVTTTAMMIVVNWGSESPGFSGKSLTTTVVVVGPATAVVVADAPVVVGFVVGGAAVDVVVGTVVNWTPANAISNVSVSRRRRRLDESGVVYENDRGPVAMATASVSNALVLRSEAPSPSKYNMTRIGPHVVTAPQDPRSLIPTVDAMKAVNFELKFATLFRTVLHALSAAASSWNNNTGFPFCTHVDASVVVVVEMVVVVVVLVVVESSPVKGINGASVVVVVIVESSPVN